MAQIPIPGVPSSYLTPGNFLYLAVAQGPSTASAGARSVLYQGAKLSAGSAVVNTVYQVKSENDAIELAGEGSPVHRAVRMHLRKNKRGKVYIQCYAETSGGSPVAATGTVTFTTAATGRGTASVTVCGETISVAVNSGDAIATIAANVAAAINARGHLPVTATSDAGVVTLTAKVLGSSQGDGTTGVIRFRAAISSGIGTSVATSGAALGLDAGTAGVDGTTTETANLLAALNAIAASKYYYVVPTKMATSSDLTNLASHLAAKNDPITGLRSVGLVGFTGSTSAARTLAVAANDEYLQLGCQPSSEHDTAELVGWLGATRQAGEGEDTAYNFNGSRDSLLLKVYDESQWLDGDDINDLLTDGVTPINSDQNGGYLVKSVTTRSKNAAGTVDDQRAAETRVVSVSHEFMDELAVRFANTYEGFKLMPDSYLADGVTLNPRQKRYPRVVRPSEAKPLIVSQLRAYEGSRLKNVDASVQALEVVIDPNNSGRLEAQVNLDVVNWLNQITVRIHEVGAA